MSGTPSRCLRQRAVPLHRDASRKSCARRAARPRESAFASPRPSSATTRTASIRRPARHCACRFASGRLRWTLHVFWTVSPHRLQRRSRRCAAGHELRGRQVSRPPGLWRFHCSCPSPRPPRRRPRSSPLPAPPTLTASPQIVRVLQVQRWVT
ncbi:hypothetical protein BD626DRAFT_172886 [Schizophyllum amplum]|uniref:Uncharacterized protein n=1 Tax=Schizophyllum amplum TaxID=97359 RepID=A0A550C311_9AGAR|nr:hypothetical protein BD626DRAFT_172886 [Auriculariopsis ampla]